MASIRIEMTAGSLDSVTGGRLARFVHAPKTNNSTIVLKHMSLNAPTSGSNNIGGLAISVQQVIS
jgi:hypothetical protein